MKFKGKNIRVWFMPGVLDCLTVLYDNAYYGILKHALGFNQFVGDTDQIQPGNHLGRELNFIPKAVTNGLQQRGY